MNQLSKYFLRASTTRWRSIRPTSSPNRCRKRPHAAALDRPRRPRHLPVLAESAVDADPGGHDPGLARRHVLRHEDLRLHDQHDHALRVDPSDRTGRRQRDRRHREHRPTHRDEKGRHSGIAAPRKRCPRSRARWWPRRSYCSRCSFRWPSFPGTTGQLYKQFALTIAARSRSRSSTR